MNNEGLIFPKLTERQKDLYLKIIVNLNTYGYFDRGFGSQQFNPLLIPPVNSNPNPKEATPI